MNLSVMTAAFVALFPIVNPIGALAGFAGLTADFSPAEIRKQAVRTGIYVFAILAIFTIAGSLVLDAFGINLAAVQLAGGIIVAQAGLNMLNPKPTLSADEQAHAQTKAQSHHDISFSPMALPLVAGPGAMGVVIALAARHTAWSDHLEIVAAIALLTLCIVVLLRWGTPLIEKLGPTGIGAIMRIMGFFILCIGVELFVVGLKHFLHF